MKKLLLIFFCLLGLSIVKADAQDKMYCYGVDFSYAKVFAADETVEQFAKAFSGVNLLFISEPDKYDMSHVFYNKSVENVIEPMLAVVTNCDYSNLKTYSSKYEQPDYSVIIKNYELPQTEGEGLILIAKLLDKPRGIAAYELVIFDIATREILIQREVTGKARGFGLRNYWAGSIYNVIINTSIQYDGAVEGK